MLALGVWNDCKTSQPESLLSSPVSDPAEEELGLWGLGTKVFLPWLQASPFLPGSVVEPAEPVFVLWAYPRVKNFTLCCSCLKSHVGSIFLLVCLLLVCIYICKNIICAKFYSNKAYPTTNSLCDFCKLSRSLYHVFFFFSFAKQRSGLRYILWG